MYLDSIVNLYNSEIVAWGISDHPDAALCVETVGKLSERYGSGLEGVVLHSDCGATYTSLLQEVPEGARDKAEHGRHGFML